MAAGESQKTKEEHRRQEYAGHRYGVLLVVLAVLLAGLPVLVAVAEPHGLTVSELRACFDRESEEGRGECGSGPCTRRC